MIKYIRKLGNERKLGNRGNNGVQFKRPKEMIITYLRIHLR